MAARTFNGTSQYIDFAESSALTNALSSSNECVVAVWCRWTTFTSFRNVFNKRRGTSSPTINLIGASASNQFEGIVRWTTAGDSYVDTVGLSANKWYLVIFSSKRSEVAYIATYDEYGTEVDFQAGSVTPGGSDTILQTSASGLRVGARYNTGTYTACEVGHVAVWSDISAMGARSSGAVRPARAYMTGGPCSIPPKWAWWPRGSSEYDYTLGVTTAATETASPGTTYSPLLGRAPWMRRRRIVRPLHMTIPVDSASFAFTSSAVGLKASRRVAVDSASFSMTATSVGIIRAAKLGVDSSSFAFASTAVGTRASRAVVVASAALAFSPTDVSLKATRIIGIASAAIAFTATDVAVRRGRNVVIDSASFAFTTAAVGLRAARRTAVDSAIFAFVATDVGARASRRLSVDSSTFAFTATAVGLRAARRLGVSSASFTFSASDLSLVASGIAAPLRPASVDVVSTAWTADTQTLTWTVLLV